MHYLSVLICLYISTVFEKNTDCMHVFKDFSCKHLLNTHCKFLPLYTTCKNYVTEYSSYNKYKH